MDIDGKNLGKHITQFPLTTKLVISKMYLIIGFSILGGIGIRALSDNQSDDTKIVIFLAATFFLLLVTPFFQVRAFLSYFWQLRHRATVDVYESGICVRFKNGKMESMAYKEATAMSADFFNLFVRGDFWGQSANIQIFREEDSFSRPSIILKGNFPGNQMDNHPIMVVYNNFYQALQKQMKDALAQKKMISGDSWKWEGNELTIHKKIIYIPDIIAVEQEEGKIRFWIQGKEDCVAQLDPEKANALILLSLIKEELAKKSVSEEGLALGRMIAKKKFVGMSGILLIIFAFITFGLPLGMFIVATAENTHKLKKLNAFHIIAGFSLAILYALPLFFIIYRTFTKAFYLYTKGMKLRWTFWTDTIRDEEITGLTYAATAQYINEVYQGTLYEIVVQSDKKKISYKATLSEQETELEEMCDRISSLLAKKTQEKILNEPRVFNFTAARLTFLQEGIQIAKQKFVGGYSKDEEFVAYSQIKKIEFNEGKCSFFLPEDIMPKPLSIGINEHNFWPMYFVLSYFYKKP